MRASLTLMVVAILLAGGGAAARAESPLPYRFGAWTVHCFSGIMANEEPACFIQAEFSVASPNGARTLVNIHVRSAFLNDHIRIDAFGVNPASCRDATLTETLTRGYTVANGDGTAQAVASLSAAVAKTVDSHIGFFGNCMANDQPGPVLLARFRSSIPELDAAIAHIERHWSWMRPEYRRRYYGEGK